MRKKTIICVITAIILMALIAVGIFGYVEAQKIRMQAGQIKKITAETLNLKPIKNDEFEIPVKDWENAADKSEFIRTELNKFDKMPELLKEDIGGFYSGQALKRMKEAEFLQFLIDSQRNIGLQAGISEKSKGQIETVLERIKTFKNDFNRNKLSFTGSDFEPYALKLQAEETNFESYLKGLYGKMTYDSGKVMVETASFSNAFDEFKVKLIESLNDRVLLQERIKGEISRMGKDIWVNPFR